MPYIAEMTDKPGTTELRAKVRDVHLEYLDANKAKLLAAGALLRDDGIGEGSVYIIDTEDRKTAEAFVAGDPFAKAGLFGRTVIRRWRKAFFNFENCLALRAMSHKAPPRTLFP